VVRHELVHNFQGALARAVIPEANLDVLQNEYGLPLWWTEGEAEYRAGDHKTCRGISRDILLRDMVLSDKIPTFGALMESPWGFEHYLIGFEAHRYLAQVFGDSLNIVLYRNLSVAKNLIEGETTGGAIFAKAFEKTYGVSLGKFYEMFRHSLRLRYFPQYNEARIPIDLLALPFGEFTYAAPIKVYQSAGKTVAIFYSADDGIPKIYRLAFSGPDVRGNFLDDEDEPRVIAKAGRRGYEEIDPWVDLWRDSLLVLAVLKDGSYDLVVRDIWRRAEILRQKFPNLRVLNSPSWSPDGKQIVFSASFYSQESDSSGIFDLYVYDRETGKLRRLTNDIYWDANPRWNPREPDLILFESDRNTGGREGYTNLFIFDLRSGLIKPITSGRWHDYYANWSEDGRSVIFTSDRDGNYDLYRVFLDGKSARLTRYWGSAILGHFLPGDSAVIFSGSAEGKRRLYIQDLDKNSMVAVDSLKDSLRNNEEDFWQWRIFNDSVPRKYKREYRLEGFCGGELLAGYGYGVSCGAIVPDFLNDEWFFASLGISNFSWVPGQGRLGANLGFVNLGGRLDYLFQAYYADNPAIDIPIRHAFHETRIGAGTVIFYPFSRFFRLEAQFGPEYLKERDLYDWSNPFDLNHGADTIHFRTKGLTFQSGVSLVGDNSLHALTGPVFGYRYRVGALATVNLSALSPVDKWISYGAVVASPAPEARQSFLTNYVFHADLRHYLRLGMFSNFGLRFFGYYSDGAVPTYVSFGKLNGMAAFYPWHSPYGSKGWMINSRLTVVPFVKKASFDLPLLGQINFVGIAGEVFYDLAQTWFRNSNRGPIYCDRGVGLRIPLALGMMRLDWGRICVIPLKSGYRLPEFYKNSKFGINFGYSF
jgi:hypothetical protein